MTGLNAPARELADQLHRAAGSYLQSVVREPSVTCAVCATPVGPKYELCLQCNAHRRLGLPLADRVGSLVYAVMPDSQTYLLVYNYKTTTPGPSHEREMLALLALGLRGHMRCVNTLAGLTNTAWCVVPSTRGRPKLHELVTRLARPKSREVKVSSRRGHPQGRGLNPEMWSVELGEPPPDHVIVVDDSWVTGSNAQSLASALKQSGVLQVSVFTVANVLAPDWNPNKEFIKQRLKAPAFHGLRCPWTGGLCP